MARFSGLTSLCIAALCFYAVYGWPSGAPEGACNAMRPNHTYETQNGTLFYHPQSGLSNYTIGIDTTTVKPGEVIEVNITAENGDYFKGFFIQARDIKHRVTEGVFKERHGTFTPEDAAVAQTRCDGQALTHINNNAKMIVKMTWVAPAEEISNFHFVATVVRSECFFFQHLKSETVNSNTIRLTPSLALLILAVLIHARDKLSTS